MTLLERALAALDGVDEATVEMIDGAPTGVKVQLAPDADEGTVAARIQGLLAEHGLGSNLAPPRSKLEPMAPPPPPVVPDREMPDREVPDRMAEVEVAPVVEAHEVAPPPDGGRTLAEVQVVYSSAGAVVTARSSDGIESSRPTRAEAGAFRQAVVEAVAELAKPESPAPGVVDIEVREVGDERVVTVVIDVGRGQLRAGSGIVEIGFEHALAQATWSALVS